MHTPLTSIEICAGAGGQALGLERAGFNHLVAVEIDDWAVKTLQANRPEWNVIQADVLDFDVSPYAGADRLPKSIARVHTPRLHGVQALAELKALRSHALSQSLPYGVLFMCLGQTDFSCLRQGYLRRGFSTWSHFSGAPLYKMAVV